MAQVTMENVKAIQKAHHTTGNYLPVECEGRQYVQIIDMDTCDTDNNGTPYWEGYAVRLDDEIDEDGYAPLYTLIWDMDNPDAEDGADTVDDWDNVDDVNEVGGINVTNGNIC